MQNGGIQLDDAIDVRQIKNIKLANQMLKVKRKIKEARDIQVQQSNIQAQADAQASTAEKTAMAEVQKQEAISGSKVQYEQARTQMEIQKMEVQAKLDQQKMQMQHQFDLRLAQMQGQASNLSNQEKENRKDKRIKMEGTQQSEMISQRKNDGLPINFEQQQI